MARVGIMGGTFDPVHYGHLVTAEEARVQFALERVIFVPNRYPPHKRVEHVTDPEHRHRMTRLAVDSNPAFAVSRIEIDRPAPSFTIDTIRALRGEHGARELFYITGADAILQIVRGEWEGAAELLTLCEFIAASRPGFPIEAHDLRKYNVTRQELDNLHVMEIPALSISSTDIRGRVAAGRPIRYLTPDQVVAYIAEHGLYRRPVRASP